jgi:hypothetical protein
MRRIGVTATLAALFLAGVGTRDAGAQLAQEPLKPKVKDAIAYARSRPLRDLPKLDPSRRFSTDPGEREGPPGERPTGEKAHIRDGALQTVLPGAAMPAPLFTFEGPSNQDNFNTFGFRVNPPDPVGDVGNDQYVAMVNLVYSVYSKTGELLGGPFDTGTLWQDFPVEDCTDPSGDPIVFYDEIANRWVLTQFTTRFATNQFYICMAVSATPDALGEYHLHAFSTGDAFPDYPKYGLWRDAYVFTTREFDNGGVGPEQIGIYALKRTDLLGGSAAPRMVQFTLSGPPNLVGDGLLPADLDGKRLPPPNSPIPLVGSQDDDAFDGATFDALNVFHLTVKWSKPEESTFALVRQVPISEYDTNYPCTPPTRDCLPQPPPATNTTDKLDILSYRQRPMHRLQYRNFGTHESLVTNQSVEARPNVAGIRWWELRNPADPVLHQEGTWSPDDVHRWMGSVAMDRDGNLALGYSVVNATNVFPGIRYAGRLAGDPLGQLTQGEAELQAGSGVQRTTNSRWGDYTSMNLDPKDDCTFYYINEYYTAESQATSTAGWLTRIGAFKFPTCKPGN